MAHDIETDDDKASFVSAREDAWHRLGTILESGFTAEEAMKHAYLGGWNLRKAPLKVVTEDGQLLKVPNRSAIIRDNPFHSGRIDVLGSVGNRYQIIQNEEHATFLNALVDESGSHFETAGSLDNGKRVFITMKLPGHMKVGGRDRVDNYIAAVNSHDGSSSFTVMVTPIRVVCKNTLNVALGSASNKFHIRHTKGATQAVQEAREKLDMTFEYLAEFQETAERLINSTMSQVRFEEIIQAEFGAPDEAGAAAATRADKKIEQLEWLFAESCTQTDICNTAWAGFNALTEWFDHMAPTRGTERETKQASNALFDVNFKARALELMLAG